MRASHSLRSSVRQFGAASAVLLLSLLSCGREITGPGSGVRMATGLSFVSEFPRPLAELEAGAGDVVPFSRVRILLQRRDNSVALDQTYPFGATTDSLPLSLNIPLSQNAPAEGEPLALFLRYINATGDTVFSGGPVSVVAVQRRRGDPLPPPAQVPLAYTGPGASATTVELSPDTLAIFAGDPFAFTATARDSQGTAIANAPIIFTSLDPDKAPLTSLTAPTGTSLVKRGMARIRAVLAANGASSEAVLLIAPKPASLARLGLTALTGLTNRVLADSVVVRLLATDGLPMADAAIAVTIEGGGSVNDTTLTTDATGRAAVQWTLGNVVGTAAQRLRFTSAGVAEVVVTADVTAPVLQASRLVITQQPVGPAVSLAPLTPTLTIEARDSASALVTDFSGAVQVAVASGPVGGVVGAVTSVNAVNGVASFPALSANLVGAYRLRVSSGTLLPDTTDAFTVIAGAAGEIDVVTGFEQTALVGTALPEPITVLVTDDAGNRVPGATVTFAVTSGGGLLSGATQVTDSLGQATLGGWTLGTTSLLQSISATVSGVPPITIIAFGQPLAPVIELNIVGSNVVGFQREGALRVRLLQPAPAGGLSVSVSSDSTQYLTIGEPGAVTLAAGDTAATIGVFGASIGNAVVRANAQGYTPDTLVVPVSLNLISLPTSLNVSLNGTASLPVQLSTAAPAGGAVVRLTSVNPATARTTADSVIIAAGSTTANATVQGLTIGSTIITASNPNYAPASTTVGVTAAIDIVNTSLSFNQSFGAPMTVRLTSGGNPIAAPAGGIVVNLSAVNPACVNVPSSAVIGAGLSNVVVNVTAGAGPTFPCNSIVRAEGPAGFATDSITASVAATPTIGASNDVIGAGLQSGNGFSLSVSNHGGTTVRIASLEPARVLIAPNAATLGSAFIDVPVLINNTTGAFTVQTLEGVNEDTVAVTLSAPGFVTDTITIVITQPLHSISSLNASTTTGTLDDPFTIRIGSPSSPIGNAISNFDVIRFGGADRTFSIVNDSTTRGELVTSTLVADSVTVVIAAGSSASPSTVATGGVAFRVGEPGITFVRLTSPLSRPSTTATIAVTTVLSSITSVTGMTGGASVGRGLQRSASISLSEAVPAGDSLQVTVRASRPGFAVLSRNNGVAGTSDSVVTVVPGGSATAPLSVQILESAPLDTFSLIVSAPGYQGRIAAVQVIEPLVRIATDLLGAGTVGQADDPFRLETGSPGGPTGNTLANADIVRLGGPGLAVTIVNDSAQVGTLVTSSGTTDSLNLVIPAGGRFTASTVATGGVAFRYIAQGTAVLRASSPVARAMPDAIKTVAVTVTVNTISNVTSMGIGAGLQRSGTITLNTPAPTGGLPVLLVADKSNRIRFAPNATTLGTDSLVVTVNAGATSANYVLQVLDVVPDTVVVTASAPGYLSRTANIFIWQPVIDFTSILTTFTTLSSEDLLFVRIGSPGSAVGTTISISDSRRFGAPPLPVTVTSSDGFVGRLVTSSVVSDTVVVTILAGTSATGSSLATGGVAFRPLTAGTTTIAADAPGVRRHVSANGTLVTVSTPGITISTISNVGAGLQTGANLTLGASQHGGVNVIVKSSNPAVARVSRNATDIATDSIIVPLADLLGSFTFNVAGMEGVTGQVVISARAAGFTDGSAVANVVTPAVEITALTTTQTAGAADVQFRTRVGTPNGTLTAVATAQNARAGGPGVLVTLTSSNTAVGTLVTSTTTGSPVTVTIAQGQAASPVLVSSGGVGFRPLTAGTTTVTATAPGFTTMTNGGNVTVTVSP